VKRVLTQLYERDARRYLVAAIALIAAEVLCVTIPLGTFIAARYEGLSVGRFFLSTAVVLGIAVPLQALAVLLVGANIRLLLNWARDPDPRVAPDVIRVIHGLARRSVLRIAAAYVVLFVPVVIIAYRLLLHRIGLADVAFLGLGVVVITAYGAQLVFFTIELLTGPVVAHAAAVAPEGNRVAARSVPITIRLLLGVFMAAVGGGALVSTISGEFGAGSGAGLKMLGVSLGIAATFGAAFMVAAVLTVLEPTRDLINGATAVRRGDLDVQVPVSSADELGELAESFNDMVRGLRERERLRSRNDELIDELRASRERIVATADAARRRVERDLHDGAQQRLVLLSLKAVMLEREQGVNPLTTGIRQDIDLALTELRDLAHGLYPQVLESDGLPAALEEAARNAAIPTTVDCDAAGRHRPELEAAVYFCCLEALQNAAKHAGAGARATVSLAQLDGVLRFAVSDDGRGFDPATIGSSSGLQNMSDRMGALGGQLQIDASPGAGTRITGSVPAQILAS
jgi:signal transduction histidine kinase